MLFGNLLKVVHRYSSLPKTFCSNHLIFLLSNEILAILLVGLHHLHGNGNDGATGNCGKSPKATNFREDL